MKNNFYNVLGGGGRIAIKFLTILLLIRAIGLEQYGIWILVASLIESLLVVESGFAASTTVYLARELNEDDVEAVQQTLTTVIAGILILASTAALAVFFLVPELSFVFRKLSENQYMTAVEAIRWSSIVLAGRMLQQVSIGIQQAQLKYGRINLMNTLQTLILSAGLVWVASTGAGIVGMMQCYAAVTVVFLAVHTVSALELLRGIPLRPKYNRVKTLALAKYSAGSWGSSLGSVMFAHFDKLVVGALLGPTILAVYGFTTSVCAQINAVSAMAVQPLLPTLSRIWTQSRDRVEAVEQEVRRAVELNCLIALSAAALLMAASPWLLLWLIPDAVSHETVFGFRTAAVIYGVYSLNGVGFFILYAIHQVGRCMVVQLVCGAIALGSITIGALSYGLYGAILGNGAYWLVWGLTVVGMKSLKIPFREWGRWFLSPIAAFGLCAVLAFMLPDGLFAVALKIFVAILMFSLFLIRFLRYNFPRNNG